MEIPNAVVDGKPVSVPPAEYERFYLRRLFWKEMGLHYDQMSRVDVQESLTFIRLEKEHPHRFEQKESAK